MSRRAPASDAEGEAWGEPVNLGPSDHSVENEYGVAIAPDGSMLYFSSNRPRAGDAAPATDAAWAATLRERRSRNDYDLYAIELARDANAALASTAQKSGTDPSAPSATLPAAAHSLDALNTNADEGAPAVSPFGDFLYFA